MYNQFFYQCRLCRTFWKRKSFLNRSFNHCTLKSILCTSTQIFYVLSYEYRLICYDFMVDRTLLLIMNGKNHKLQRNTSQVDVRYTDIREAFDNILHSLLNNKLQRNTSIVRQLDKINISTFWISSFRKIICIMSYSEKFMGIFWKFREYQLQPAILMDFPLLMICFSTICFTRIA